MSLSLPYFVNLVRGSKLWFHGSSFVSSVFVGAMGIKRAHACVEHTPNREEQAARKIMFVVAPEIFKTGFRKC